MIHSLCYPIHHPIHIHKEGSTILIYDIRVSSKLPSPETTLHPLLAASNIGILRQFTGIPSSQILEGWNAKIFSAIPAWEQVLVSYALTPSGTTRQSLFMYNTPAVKPKDTFIRLYLPT